MKIALVRKTYSPYGGAERYLAQLIDRLSQQGHEIHVFAHNWETKVQDHLRERKKSVVFHRVFLIPSPSFLEALSFAYFSKRLLEEGTFDIIHSFERTLYQDIYRAGDGCHREWLIQRKKMDPWIKRLSHPVNPLHRSLLFLEKRLFQSARLKKIMANSQRGKEDIIRHYGVPPEKIEVIYNGVDLDVFHPRNVALYRNPLREELGIDPEAYVILFLGSGFWRKGLDSLIASFPKIKKEIPQAYLIVAGKDRTHEYRERAVQLGVENGIRFLGPTQRGKELCAASDLFALPTVYDPFSNACLEAMATGIPVLTTLQNGIAELIRDGENGFLISEPKEGRQIGEKIIAHSHSDKKGEMGRRARETCLPLDMNLVIHRMLRVYESVR